MHPPTTRRHSGKTAAEIAEQEHGAASAAEWGALASSKPGWLPSGVRGIAEFVVFLGLGRLCMEAQIRWWLPRGARTEGMGGGGSG